jgi:VanZ family protein
MVWLRRICWTLTGAYWAGIFVLTHLPPTQLRKVVPDIWDKLAHFLAYFLLAAFLGAALMLTFPRRRAIPLWVLVIGWAYGVIDELLQPFIRREATLLDWVADALGVWAAVLLLWILQRWVVLPRLRAADELAAAGVTAAQR